MSEITERNLRGAIEAHEMTIAALKERIRLLEEPLPPWSVALANAPNETEELSPAEKRQLKDSRKELAERRNQADRERIEFIRRAYLARLDRGTPQSDENRYHVYIPGTGEITGRAALRYLAEQDWEAVREL